MGTDIHLHVEYKDSNEQWLTPEPVLIRCPREKCDYLLDESYCYECDKGKINIYDYKDRNYWLFGILADIRNEELELEPISQPRGIPESRSAEYSRLIELDRDYYYGFSYHTLTQLEKYNWDKTAQKTKFLGTTIKDSYFYETFMQTLKILANQHGGSDNVRILFYFDS